ncbi:GGDEF domain-containing protein [Sulfurospirillum sp. 1307]
MKNKFSLSLSTYILLAVFVSVFGSFLFAKMYIEKQNSEALYKSFKEEREEITKNIARYMVEPIKKFSPSEGSKALEITKNDKKIVKILIYDELLDIDFINIYIPNRAKGNLFKNRETIYDNSKKIGWVEITFNDAKIQKELESANSIIFNILLFSSLILMITMYSILQYKILRPIMVLNNQALDFQNNRLDKQYFWSGNDELSSLGKSFESAKVSILNLLKKLSKKNEELERLYITDKLTGIYNRHKLDIVLEEEERRCDRYKQSFGVIIVDIDNFKYINDTYGHLVGDRVLKEIAWILKENVRKTDTLGRWGGEEFLIIVPQCSKEDLFEISKKLKDYISNYDFKLDKHITASFGISMYKNDLNTLLKNADDALYQIKTNGKNAILFL